MDIKRNFVHLLKYCLAVGLVLLLYLAMNYREHFGGLFKANPEKRIRTDQKEKIYLIVYYNLSPFVRKHRKDSLSYDFQSCQWTNCQIIYDGEHANMSDAVIFNGIFMPESLNFTRPLGQVWIFHANEPPIHYNYGGNWWYRNKTYVFNWTMTYNSNNTDIYLPYGEIRRHSTVVKKDFESIALQKNGTLLMIASNCKAQSRRQEYVEQLKKYIDVDVLGKCGRRWSCGVHFKHDDCFLLLNKYRFYLAFENSFCNQYFSEKFFENFNYDTILISRGGSRGDAKKLFPDGTYLSTDDFQSIKDLGMFLQNLTFTDYIQLLERKSQYYATTYKPMHQRALCEICKRMNFQHKYWKTIKNIKKWAFHSKPCLKPEEVQDIDEKH